MIQYLIIHSTGTEKDYVPEKKEYNLSVSCDIVHFNGQLSSYKAITEHPSSNETYQHIAYIGGKIDGKASDTATWKQYDSMEHIVMYHLLYNQNLKVGCSSLFFDNKAGLDVRRWLEDIGVNKKNIM
jgi:hypothetical protein|tara:strand:+ start:183 stop:563 length:381 start_codon:yes stop_codon:yes gene_type:complete